MTERKIPGTFVDVDREYRYVSDDGENDFSKLFKKLTMHQNPRKATDGGAITENCKIKLPDGSIFHGLSYRGDIEGWREDIEQQARMLSLLTAKIQDDKVEVSDGRSFSLSDCTVEFYQKIKTRRAIS